MGIAVSHWWDDITVKPWLVVTHDRVNFHNKYNSRSLSGILFSKYVGVTTLRGPSQYTVKGQVGKSKGKERSNSVPQPDAFSRGWICHSKKTMLARNSQICNLYIPREVCVEACSSFREESAIMRTHHFLSVNKSSQGPQEIDADFTSCCI